MELGKIVYLYICNFEEGLLVRQKLNKDRFCKVVDIIPVKGGDDKNQYLQYTVKSLFADRTYTINNYLSSYGYCDISDVDIFIEKYKDKLAPHVIQDMIDTLKEVREIEEGK